MANLTQATKHANIRSQQRGVSQMVVDLLVNFGARDHDGKGAEICYFDHRARKRLDAYSGGILSRLSAELDTYAVIANGQVVTVGIRTKRVNRR